MANLPVANLTSPLATFTPVARKVNNLGAFGGHGNAEKNIHAGFGPPYTPIQFLTHSFLHDASRIDPTWNPGYPYGGVGMLDYLSAGGGGGGGTVGYPI